MRVFKAIFSIGATAVLISGCIGGTGSNGDSDSTPEPSPFPTESAKLLSDFEDLSGLIIPSNASDLEIEPKYLEGGRPRYKLRFLTTRGGAEVICTGENIGVYDSDGPPDEEQHDLFDIREADETIAETVECRGSHPTNGRVQRTVVVLFPKDGLKKKDGEPDGKDSAIVYAYSVMWPSR
ncbi:hypothetical protein GCM10009799_32830 [Nocardiopsis rhodophaea]|uniref:Lipoprotein n=1 Tax=Nocardiopsis rhodophaea TaxID=280238 RepID=A0ABP5ERD8_9ACTN